MQDLELEEEAGRKIADTKTVEKQLTYDLSERTEENELKNISS